MMKLPGRLFYLKNIKMNKSTVSHEINLHDNLNNEGSSSLHIPVMKEEVVNFFSPKVGQIFVDMTFGAGGHSRALMAFNKGITLYGLDRDPKAYSLAVQFSKEHKNCFYPLLGRFSELPELFSNHDIEQNSLDGIMIDAGCSSMQFDQAHRGFSISKDGPLDMRMDGDRFPEMPTAADVINGLDSYQLAKIFKTYGEEKLSKKIAAAIIDARYMMKEIYTTQELATLVSFVAKGITPAPTDKLDRPAHYATRVFQALRIFVNNELNELNYAMEVALKYLKPGGKLAALTFHSLEDRIVKRHLMGVNLDDPVSKGLSQKFRNSGKWHTENELEELMPKNWIQMTKHVLLPTEQEVHDNPRSRSAKLRVAIKL